LSNDFANYRRDLSVLETSGGRIPSIQHNPPTASSPHNLNAPWMPPQNGPAMPSNTFGTSFYDDSSDTHSVASQLSPGLRPGTGRTASDPEPTTTHDDERRPSLASIATASSSGSRGSVVRAGLHKKLQGFFGEEYTGREGKEWKDRKEGREGSETNVPSQTFGKEHRSNSYSRHRDRKTSTATDVRDSSPAPSRPRTPVPSSEVVPFLYQDSQVSSYRPCDKVSRIATDKELGYIKVRRSACAPESFRTRQRAIYFRRG
jgi:adenylate cyclase